MYRRGTAGKSALSLRLEPSRAIMASPRLVSGCEANFGISGRFPFAILIESRTVALPNEGDRCRLMGAGSCGGGTDGLGTVGIGGIWEGSCPCRARNESAVIQSACRSPDTVVNFSARAGVRMRIDRFQAAVSSGFLGNGVSSGTSRTDCMATAKKLALYDAKSDTELTLAPFLAEQRATRSWLFVVPHDRALIGR